MENYIRFNETKTQREMGGERNKKPLKLEGEKIRNSGKKSSEF